MQKTHKVYPDVWKQGGASHVISVAILYRSLHQLIMGTVHTAQKHMQGVYWDTQGGCLRGTWDNGTLKGQGIYDQPSYQFKGNFKANLPEGECSFSICAHRSLGMPARAASHILADHGPVMLQKGNYMLPPGHLAPLSISHHLALQTCKSFLPASFRLSSPSPSPCASPSMYDTANNPPLELETLLFSMFSNILRHMHLSNAQCLSTLMAFVWIW